MKKKHRFIERLFFMKVGDGFTLIEILVVVGIIGILIGLGAVSYSTAQKKARDTKRKSDLQSIQNSFEQYYSVCGFSYPVSATGPVPTSIYCISPSIAIIDSIPNDPMLTPYDVIGADTAGSSYTICPPVVRDAGTNNYRLETEDCDDSNQTCCVSNLQ